MWLFSFSTLEAGHSAIDASLDLVHLTSNFLQENIESLFGDIHTDINDVTR